MPEKTGAGRVAQTRKNAERKGVKGDESDHQFDMELYELFI